MQKWCHIWRTSFLQHAKWKLVKCLAKVYPSKPLFEPSIVKFGTFQNNQYSIGLLNPQCLWVFDPRVCVLPCSLAFHFSILSCIQNCNNMIVFSKLNGDPITPKCIFYTPWCSHISQTFSLQSFLKLPIVMSESFCMGI